MCAVYEKDGEKKIPYVYSHYFPKRKIKFEFHVNQKEKLFESTIKSRMTL